LSCMVSLFRIERTAAHEQPWARASLNMEETERCDEKPRALCWHASCFGKA
jgi:hypothetical protein